MARVTIPAGEDPWIFVLAKLGSPALARARIQALSVQYENETTLSAREREALRVRLGQIFSAPDAYRPDMALSREFTDLWGAAPIPATFLEHLHAHRDWPGYSAREKLILEFAERFVADPVGMRLDEAFWTRLRAQVSDREIVDLCLLIGTWQATGTMLQLLDVAMPAARDSTSDGPRGRWAPRLMRAAGLADDD